MYIKCTSNVHLNEGKAILLVAVTAYQRVFRLVRLLEARRRSQQKATIRRREEGKHKL